MSEETGLMILAGLAVVSFTIRQIVKYRSDKKGRSRKMPEQKEKYHDRRGRPDELKVEKMIHLSILRGEGTEADKIRVVDQYYNMDGMLIFELDPCSPYYQEFLGLR